MFFFNRFFSFFSSDVCSFELESVEVQMCFANLVNLSF